MKMKTFITLLCLVAHCTLAYTQTTERLKNLSRLPRQTKIFPVNYQIALPALDTSQWSEDFQQYSRFLTPAVSRTQMQISSTNDGISTKICPNAAMPHAQLDTLTVLQHESQVIGMWRLLTHRKTRFTDSFSVAEKKFYRSDTILVDDSQKDGFAVFTNNHLKLYSADSARGKLKTELSSKYTIENRRFLMAYKLFKGGAGVSQVGIEQNGYLIINYPSVIEHFKKDEYITFITVLEQLIYEKIE